MCFSDLKTADLSLYTYKNEVRECRKSLRRANDRPDVSFANHWMAGPR